jgi:hypothetical protein
MNRSGSWDQADRDRFIQAMVAWGDTQTRCAARLRDGGLRSATQTAVSRWANGRIKRPHPKTLAALYDYIDTAPVSHDSSGPSTSEGEPEGEFDATVRDLTKEPLLGPRQAALVDGMTERLHRGPSLSVSDLAAYRDQQVLLGLRPRPASR